MPTENWWFWFERNPSQHFIAAIRRVFPDFEPVDAGWDKLGKVIELRACRTVDQVRSMQPHDVELFLDLYWPPAVPAAKQIIEPGGAVAASENEDAANSVRSTKKKRHEIAAKVVELIGIIAKDRQVHPRRILAEVNGMSHEQLSRALRDECNFDTSGKNVSRWRDDVKKLQAKARSMGPLEAADDEDDEDDVEVSLEEARQHGLSARSRIDGITRLGADRRR